MEIELKNYLFIILVIFPPNIGWWGGKSDKMDKN